MASGKIKTKYLTLKSGYLYIYVSNATPNIDVFFDNLQVTHSRGAILEENSYYPFGLQMAGISNKSAGKLENRYKYNGGTELNSDFDINLYETPFRGYDPQIGRFHQIDALASFYTSESPYSFAYNNPVNFNDPLGLDPEPKPITSDIFNDLWNSAFGGSWNTTNGPTTYGSQEEALNSTGVKYTEGSCIWCETVDRALTMSEVVVTGSTKPHVNTLADRAFGWANFNKRESDQWGKERSVYETARNRGFTEDQMYDSWSMAGISDEKLASYERGWRAEKDYRTMSVVTVALPAAIYVIGESGVLYYGYQAGLWLANGVRVANAISIEGQVMLHYWMNRGYNQLIAGTLFTVGNYFKNYLSLQTTQSILSAAEKYRDILKDYKQLKNIFDLFKKVDDALKQ